MNETTNKRALRINTGMLRINTGMQRMNAKMLRILVLLLMFLSVCLPGRAFAATLKVESRTKGVTIYEKQVLVTTDVRKLKLRAVYNGRNVTKRAKWKTNRKRVVSVYGKGKLKIRQAGTARITCRYKGKKTTFTVVVVQNSHMSGTPLTREAYIYEVARTAVQLYPYTRILPSVVIAQACLETGYGMGEDAALLMQHNNLLGMKAYLLDESWSEWSAWKGRQVDKRTPEYQDGEMIYIVDSFRSYPDYCTCIIDYEQFLMRVQYKGKYKYRHIRGMKDPVEVITAISRGGYATDPEYIRKVLNIIETNDLTRFDP